MAVPITSRAPARREWHPCARSGVAHPCASSETIGWWLAKSHHPVQLGKADILLAQRHRAQALAGCRKIGVQHRRRPHADGGLADAAPEPAAWHHDGLDLRHLGYSHRIVGIEVGLLYTAVLDGAAAIDQRAQPVDE